MPAGFSSNSHWTMPKTSPRRRRCNGWQSAYASHYEYCYYDTGVASSCTTWINNGASRQVTLGGLELLHTYAWQVRAWNDTVGPTYANSGSYWILHDR